MENESELLTSIARRAMLEKGLEPDYSKGALEQSEGIDRSAAFVPEEMQDLRSLLWCSIDNDDSKDLDQLTVAYENKTGGIRICIAVADVDALVLRNTPIDLHARANTTSVYTPAKIFAMLPEKLSTDLTSLNENEERTAIIFDIDLNDTAEIVRFAIYRAMVKNKAKLTYSAVGAWLEGRGPIPEKVENVEGLAENLRLQDRSAQMLKRRRQAQGALTFETIEMKAVIEDGKVVSLVGQERNRAHELIENFMIAANTTSAKYSKQQKIPSLRRVVRVPERWDRIVELAATFGETLPVVPEAIALDKFLLNRRKANPETFPDLSLTIIKLLGSGEYVVEAPGDDPIGHFGLALRDYTHSTAPNRRYPDLITQRLLKATFLKEKTPYDIDELANLARHCTLCEDAAVRVERRVKKSAAALLLKDRIGETFQALVTGTSQKGTWVRLDKLLVEGKLVRNTGKVDVGDKIRVKLVNVDVEQGFIDFAAVD